MDSLSLDSQMLIDLYGGSYEDVRFILSDYLDKHEETINAFREAYRTSIASLRQCAHRHSSSFSYIGLPQLTQACRDFELDCKIETDTKSIAEKFENLLGLIDQGTLLVRQELERLQRA